jgi:hypothetical protein
MIILCFVNEPYIRVARNWLLAVDRLGLSPGVTLVTLDAAAEDAFQGAGIATLNRPLPSRDVADLWLHRTKVILTLLREGHDIVHSDADAVWLRNPLPHLFDDGEDMVFSQGTTWPLRSLERRRFVLCGGLFAIRSSQKSIAFWDQVASRLERGGDDQKVLNHLIDRRFSEWTIKDPYELTFRNRTILCSREKITAAADGMTVSVLPHHLYPRLLADTGPAFVAHPVSAKTGVATEDVLRERKLWFLEGDG